MHSQYQMVLEDAKQLTSADQIANDCSETLLNDIDCNDADNGWGHFYPPNLFPDNLNLNSFFVKFISPKRINALYVQDWKGNGTMRIEYKDCYCPRWIKWMDIELAGDAPCRAGSLDPQNPKPVPPKWIYLSNFPTPIIKELRITKLNGFEQSIVRRLYFCGSDIVCPPKTPPYFDRPAPQNFYPDEIRKNTAILKWDAVLSDSDDFQAGYVDEYELRISQNLNEFDELINPVSILVDAVALDSDVTHRLGGLAPGTTYHADLNFQQKGPDCGTPLPWIGPLAGTGPLAPRITFTTDSDGPAERNASPEKPFKTTDPFHVFLQPNPAHERVNVSVSSGAIARISIMDLNGRTIKTTVSESETGLLIQTGSLPDGLYWIRVFRKDGSAQTVQLAKF